VSLTLSLALLLTRRTLSLALLLTLRMLAIALILTLTLPRAVTQFTHLRWRLTGVLRSRSYGAGKRQRVVEGGVHSHALFC
jgi:hypothetical protein